jgi:hypothetical protein
VISARQFHMPRRFHGHHPSDPILMVLEGQRPLLPRGGKAREQGTLRPAFQNSG